MEESVTLNSIPLIAFAIGLVLVIAAIVGKEIKITAIELPAVSERLPRLGLAVVGLSLIYVGIFDPFRLNSRDSAPAAVESAPAKAPASAPAAAKVSAAFQNTGGYYTLHTKLLESGSKCLEGNSQGGSVLGGASFMNDCPAPATGQLWKLVPASDGYYTLQTKFLEPKNMCLEGNSRGGTVLGGAAFMSDCAKPATGQLWKVVPASDGYYTLQTKALESRNQCLDGNNLGGAAFMNECAASAGGQLWKLVTVP